MPSRWKARCTAPAKTCLASAALSGHLRIGATEGFGSYVLTPLAADFQRRYPHITLDILPVPRFVSLSKREADRRSPSSGAGPMSAASCATTRCGCTARPAIWRAIRPSAHRQTGGPHVHRLCGRTAVQRAIALSGGSAASQQVILRSTSVVAQYHAALQGQSLAILPCFIAAQDPGSRRCWNRKWRSRARSGCTATRTCASSSASTCCGSSSANRRCAMPACWPAPKRAALPALGRQAAARASGSRGLLRGAFTRSRRISRKNVSSATGRESPRRPRRS